MSETDEILFSVMHEHVAVVTLNRPSVRNAVNAALALKLDDAIKRVEQDSAIRVAILTSSNDRSASDGKEGSKIKPLVGRAAEETRKSTQSAMLKAVF